MKPILILLCIVSFLGLVSCNSVSNVDYAKESTRVRHYGSKDDIVGVWQSKTVFDSPLTVSGTIHRTVRLQHGGRGIYRTKAQAAAGGLPSMEETPLTWQYTGAGVWTCFYQSDGRSCRAILRMAGPRLLMESWAMLGGGMESVRQRDVLDRPYSKLQNQAIDNNGPAQVDWIGRNTLPQ